MQLNEYVEYINGNFDPEDLDIKISEIGFNKENQFLNLDVRIKTYADDEAVRQQLKLLMVQYKQSSFINHSFSEISLQEDHPLLWQYNDMTAALYFNGEAKDGYKFYFELNRAHQKMFGQFIPFETFFNKELRNGKLFFAGFGLLAKGPLKAMTAYAKCLEAEGMSYSLSNVGEPVWWNGEKYVTGLQSPKLLILDNSYIIADDFLIL